MQLTAIVPKRHIQLNKEIHDFMQLLLYWLNSLDGVKTAAPTVERCFLTAWAAMRSDLTSILYWLREIKSFRSNGHSLVASATKNVIISPCVNGSTNSAAVSSAPIVERCLASFLRPLRTKLNKIQMESVRLWLRNLHCFTWPKFETQMVKK